MNQLKYKTCFYNVEELTNKIPDDCIRIVISYLTDKEYFEKLLEKMNWQNYEYDHELEQTDIYISNPKLEHSICLSNWKNDNNELYSTIRLSLTATKRYTIEWTYDENMELNSVVFFNNGTYYVYFRDNSYDEPIKISWLIYSNKIIINTSCNFEKLLGSERLIVPAGKLIFNLD